MKDDILDHSGGDLDVRKLGDAYAISRVWFSNPWT